VHRFGRADDDTQAMAGQLTPVRTKGMLRPAPVRFAVEVVPGEGTAQTAAVLAEGGESHNTGKASAAPEEARAANMVRDTGDAPAPEVSETDIDRAAGVPGKRTKTKRRARERPPEALQTGHDVAPQVGATASDHVRDIGGN
jgi:hypothetical protein